MQEETAAAIAMLGASKRPHMRELAVRRLAELKDPDAIPALLGELRESTDPRSIPTITAALSALQGMGAPVSVHAIAILDDSGDPRRAFMPLLLASTAGGEAVPRLIAALDDPQESVRVNAATQLGVLRDPRAFAPLLALVQDAERDDAIRGVAAAALGALGDARALPVLEKLAASPSPDLLAGAIDGLADLRDPAGIPHLEAILERPGLDERTDRAVRLALLAMERYRER